MVLILYLKDSILSGRYGVNHPFAEELAHPLDMVVVSHPDPNQSGNTIGVSGGDDEMISLWMKERSAGFQLIWSASTLLSKKRAWSTSSLTSKLFYSESSQKVYFTIEVSEQSAASRQNSQYIVEVDAKTYQVKTKKLGYPKGGNPTGFITQSQNGYFYSMLKNYGGGTLYDRFLRINISNNSYSTIGNTI